MSAISNPVGRPSEYRPEYLQKLDDYLCQCEDEHSEFHRTRGKESDGYERTIRVKLPTREGFAMYIGYSVDALADWEVEHKEFGGALKRLDALQKQRLIENGLSGDYNPVIAKLLLSANHDMREKTDAKSDVTSGGERIQGVTVEFVRGTPKD